MAGVSRSLAVSVLCLSVLANDAVAGKLGAFEADATKERSSHGRDRVSRDPYDDWDDTYPHSDRRSMSDLFLNDIFLFSLIQPGRASWARATDDATRLANLDLDAREPGDPLIPFVRFDAAYQDVESDVEALDYRVQVGYGPIGFELNHTRYWEQVPSDRLDIYRLYGLYRLSFGNMIEADLGLGAIILDGDERNTGVSTTTPILIHPADWLVAEFRPSWSSIRGSVTQEYELALLLNWNYVALRAGYRWTVSPQESLNGPFIGFSVRY